MTSLSGQAQNHLTPEAAHGAQLRNYRATGMNTHFTLDRESFQNLLARASLAQEYLDSQKATHPGVDLPRKPAIAEQPKEASPVDYIQSLSAIVAVQRAIATDQALHGSGSKSRESHDEHLDKFILHGLPAESNQLSTHARGRPPQERSWWIGSSQKSYSQIGWCQVKLLRVKLLRV